MLAFLRAGGTGRAGRAIARSQFRRILVLFIYALLPHLQNNKIHTAHAGGEIIAINIDKIARSMLFDSAGHVLYNRFII